MRVEHSEQSAQSEEYGGAVEAVERESRGGKEQERASSGAR